MAGVLCVWVADLPDSSEQWYENEYIPEMVSRHSSKVLLGDIEESGLDKELDGVATRDAAWKSLAVYEVANAQKTMESTYDESCHPRTLGGPSEGNSRFDIRAYEELKSWQKDELWDGGTSKVVPELRIPTKTDTDGMTDGADVAMILFWEWQPRVGYEREVIDFYEHELGPMFSQASEVLRLRWFKIREATVLKDGSYDRLGDDKLSTYMSLVEMDCEGWPWNEIFAINGLPKWVEFFEGQKAVASNPYTILRTSADMEQKWQASRYIVKRNYRG